jgi:CRP-like cAMP-binding protein
MTAFTKVEYAAGDFIFRAGDSALDLFMVQEGTIELVNSNTNTAFASIGPGVSLGEQALVPGGIRGASAKAVTSVIVLKISAEDLKALMNTKSKQLIPVLEALMLQQSMHNALRD